MPAEHVLKTLAPYWHAVERGEKTFEVRRDDRGFQRGDVLVLRRVGSRDVVPDVKLTGGMRDGKWTDAEFYDLRRRITYVLTGGQLGIEPGYVVMGLADEPE